MINITAIKNNTNRSINSRFFLAVIPGINSIKPLVIIHLMIEGFSCSTSKYQKQNMVAGPRYMVVIPPHRFVIPPHPLFVISPHPCLLSRPLMLYINVILLMLIKNVSESRLLGFSLINTLFYKMRIK